MTELSRREFVRDLAIGGGAVALAPSVLAAGKNDPNRFQIGIQEYTFHRILGKKLSHMDYPSYAKEKLGISHIEYWSRPFGGKHTDKAYMDELVKRTKGEGLTNVMILVDMRDQLDAKDKAQRDRSVDAHKAWVDCAAQLGCTAIRINCKSAGDRQQNLTNANDGVGRLCDYAKGTDVKIVIEPHGGNSQDPDWLLAAMKTIDKPNLGILPDFNNFGKYDRYDAVKRTLPYAPVVCAKALKFDDKGNEVHTDYYRMLKIIHESDYSGVISVEFEGRGVDPVTGSLQTKKLIENAIKAAAKG